MSSKIKKCKICQADIAANAKTCPQCGAKNKKGLIKKWWFWLIIIFAVFVIFLESDTADTDTIINEDYSFDTEATSTSTAEKTTAEETTEAEEITPLRIYNAIAETNDPAFVISEKASSFINEHKDFFPGNSKNKGAISDYVDYDITYGHLTKNISKYGDKLISLYGTVIDVWEDEELNLTYLHILDYEGKSYIVYHLGILDDVLEETDVSVYALPLTITTFENMQAQYTEAVLCAGCYVEASVY